MYKYDDILYDNGEYMGRFEDCIDIVKFREGLKFVSLATGISISVIDPLGNVIIYPMNESSFCVEARKDKDVAEKCVNCIVHSAIAAAKKKGTEFFKCPYGLLEFVVPVFINGEYVAAVCGGEVVADGIDKSANYSYPQEKYDEKLQLHYENLRHITSDRYFAATQLIEMLVTNLYSIDAMLKIAGNNLDTSKVDPRIKDAVEYIHNNYASKITVALLADKCCLSENYFSKMFSRAMKTSATDYVLNYRIQKAKEYLAQSNFKVNKIAELVGFEDPAYFHRIFKKYTGTTPSGFRNFGK